MRFQHCSFPQGDKKSGEHYTIRQTINDLYTEITLINIILYSFLMSDILNFSL